MANLTHGMNLDEVEALGRFLKQKATGLESLQKQIEARVRNASAWRGQTANRFRSTEWPKLRSQLSQMAKDLEGFGQSALNNAAEQRRVSTVSSGTASCSGGSMGNASKSAKSPFRGVVDFVDESAEAITGARDLWKFIIGKGHVGGGLKELLEPKELPNVAIWIGGIVNSARHFSDAWDGDDTSEKWKKGVGAAVSIASLIPYVGVGKFIWDVDYIIADATVSVVDEAGLLGGGEDFDRRMYRTLYGTDKPSAEQQEHLRRRYDGFAGGVRHIGDVAAYNAETYWNLLRGGR